MWQKKWPQTASDGRHVLIFDDDQLCVPVVRRRSCFHTRAMSLTPLRLGHRCDGNAVQKCSCCHEEGRKQGGGPKISLKKKKRKKQRGELANDKRINEIARREATRKKRPTVMYGRQRDNFSKQVSNGASRAPVYIRAKGEEEWLECGHVCVDVGTQTSLADAARYQKRLILEHGTRVHRRLQMQRETLECGLGPCDDDMAAVGDEASDGVVASNVVLIERSAATDEGTLPVAASFALAATCGLWRAHS